MGVDLLNWLRIFLSIAWGVGLFLLIFSAGFYWERRKRLHAFFKADKNPELWQILAGHKKVALSQEFLEEKIRLSGTGWNPKKLLLFSAVTGVSGVFTALSYLKNYWAALPLGVCGLLIPYTVLTFYISRRSKILTAQLGPMLQYFLSEYGTVSNISLALNNVRSRLDYPLKLEVECMLLEMNSGVRPEEAFFNFAHRVNSRWSYRFAHILSLRHNRGVQIQQMLFQMYMDLKAKQIQEGERKSETIGVKLESYFLYLCIPFIYFFVSKINPESHFLLTQMPEGRKIMFFIVLLLLAGIIATIRLSSNKIR